MKTYTYSRLLLSLAVTILLLAVVACREKESLDGELLSESGGVTELRFISDPMQKYNVTTRSGNAKEDAEKRIYSINIFFFTSSGDYLDGSYLTGNPNAPVKGGYYKTGEGVALLKIDPDYISVDQGEVTVCAVANVDTLFSALDADKRPLLISQMVADNPSLTAKEALEAVVYHPKWRSSVSLNLPETGMPMAGSKNITFTGSNVTSENGRIIELKALMARVDVNLQIASAHGTAKYPSFLLTEWRVKNIPDRVAVIPAGDDRQTGSEWGDGWLRNSPVQTGTATYTNGEGLKKVCTFYMFENMQDAEWIKDDGENWANNDLGNGMEGSETDLYPSGITDVQKQRYKPYLANKNATAVELKGIYHTYNDQGSSTSSVYNVSYTLYLGSNYTDNFQLRRNHQYKNNITIKGLLGITSSEGEYTFDARVNVEEGKNDFYVSILRERNHDAHICITPMDVYMFRQNEGREVEMDVTLSEIGSDGSPTNVIPDWIRMERISADDMAAGTVDKTGGFTEYDRDLNPAGTHLATGTPWTAGNGKRAFFTTDLMDKLSSSVTLTQHRDRIYFYIDEYLQSSTEPLANPRQAMVIMTYKEKSELTGLFERKGINTILLAQYPFLEVQVYGRDGNKRNPNLKYPDNDNINGTGDGVIYMEQIEEYLDHYDPLDAYSTEQIYDGLPWGNRQNIHLGSHWQYDWGIFNDYVSSWKNYILGLYYTRQIIEGYEQSELTLNEKPRSAAEYCWSRNKRAGTDDGSIYGIVKDGTEKYFLPGIRQMEDALTTYYNSFPEFQGNYYWSSSTAENDNIDYARATKVNTDGSYIESSPGNNYPDGGYAKRTESLRIRAFRSDLNK